MFSNYQSDSSALVKFQSLIGTVQPIITVLRTPALAGLLVSISHRYGSTVKNKSLYYG